jgi:hypothetical protein
LAPVKINGGGNGLTGSSGIANANNTRFNTPLIELRLNLGVAPEDVVVFLFVFLQLIMLILL